MKKGKVILLIGGTAALLLFFASIYEPEKKGKETSATSVVSLQAKEEKIKEIPPEKEEVHWAENNPIIAHALGEVDGHIYTNSKEAFLSSYEKGLRVLEVDLVFTSDNELVARHYWSEYTTNELGLTPLKGKEGEVLSYFEFKNMKIHRKYTPMSFKDVARLMEKYQDVYIVIDSKEEDYLRLYNEIIATAKEVDDGILDRIIPQFYKEEMFEIKKLYPFKSTIFSLYLAGQKEYPNERIIELAVENEIDVIVFPDYRKYQEGIVREANRLGIYSYVHPVNNVYKAKQLFDKGIKGVFSYNLSPADLEEK